MKRSTATRLIKNIQLLQDKTRHIADLKGKVHCKPDRKIQKQIDDLVLQEDNIFKSIVKIIDESTID